jgi:hypothetical protein
MPRSRSPKNPSPARHPVLTYSTPDIRDVAFYIEVDSTLKSWKTPVIGELYKDKNGEYSNHELSLVTTADENGWVKWYYVAPRIEQGAYNFEYQEPSGASSGFPSYTRSYVIKRSDVGDYFDECLPSHPAGSDYLAAGSADPDIAYNPEFCDFVLSGQSIPRIQDKELDSLYVIVTRTFISSDPQGGSTSSQWGVSTTERKIINEGAGLPLAEGIAEAGINPLGNGEAMQQTTTYPIPNVSTGVIASLTDQDEDGSTGVITDVIKALVINSKGAAYAASQRALGYFVEAKAQDQFHTVYMSSKVDLDTLPADEEFYTHENISLPNTLISIKPVWGQGRGGGFGTSKEGKSARANSSANANASFSIEVKKGFSGKTKARVIRSYNYIPKGSPQPDLITPVVISPSIGTVTTTNGSESRSASVSKNSRAASTQISGNMGVSQIGPFLTNGITDVTNNGVSGFNVWARSGLNSASARATTGASVKISLPASNPTKIISGQVVSEYQVVQKWRLGIWIVETITVYAP